MGLLSTKLGITFNLNLHLSSPISFNLLICEIYTKDQLTKAKARQCTLLSSPRTFQAIAWSYDTWRPMVDKQTPTGK